MAEESGFDSQQEKKIIFLLHSVQTDSEVHTTSYPKGNGALSPG
jgi:hypothetical protein